jgi:hypothetical protein
MTRSIRAKIATAYHDPIGTTGTPNKQRQFHNRRDKPSRRNLVASTPLLPPVKIRDKQP